MLFRRVSVQIRTDYCPQYVSLVDWLDTMVPAIQVPG